MKIRIFGTANDSIVDGPGMRYAIFCQGCMHACKGCHNPKSHAMDGGKVIDTQVILDEIETNSLLDGITLSGGEPMLQPQPLLEISKKVKEWGLNIVLYSGYRYEEILQLGSMQKELLSLCDILVDGKFEEDKKSLALLYRGSSNQRLINVQASLKQEQVVEYTMDEYGQLMI